METEITRTSRLYKDSRYGDSNKLNYSTLASAFNYDPNATILDLVPDCQYQLWIGDAGGDGWGNSYIGVYQNGINLVHLQWGLEVIKIRFY